MAFVGAEHEFHDQKYADEWAGRFEISPQREQLFEDISALIAAAGGESITILELGSGPGYLAFYLLNRFSTIKYIGLDFSKPMIELASKRIAAFEERSEFLQVDLKTDYWPAKLESSVQFVVSTWALHDLGGRTAIERVYKNCKTILDGTLINGDFINPNIEGIEYEPGRLMQHEHLDLLQKHAYQDVACLRVYEHNLEAPTPANNYACFVGKHQLM